MTTKPVPAAFGAVVLGLVGASALIALERPAQETRKPSGQGVFPGETRALHGSAALLAASVLADSGIEHYRGSFENPGMFAPLISATLALVAGAEGAAAASPGAGAFRRSAYGLSIGIGATGLAFHIYNIFKRPGGWSWLNLFYGAPVGAPAALSACGIVGLGAERLARQSAPAPRFFGISAGRLLGAFSSLALAGTVAEVALLHFRGAFQNPFMWAPVTLPPVASVVMAKASLEPPSPKHPFTRAWLWATALLGFIGMGFHAYGVSRAMGGWRNWSQNVIDGPPLPAPPSFSALSIAALSALSLIEKEADDVPRKAA
ncbi:hypothetical protein OGR47_15425 [Methylocystis sp. MJC1]|jgi:hypothetical protein|uniref:hypothetical protein n=1 Tax=Methylocystis sp. MJC1 TaxID=2654282 RepID=UPI0013EC5D27|nr:hypothetical protein [Methylocystis sp. MJC1]KAF2989882.1 hypothetical protein MJC1_03020 [Methylocystis sp. MJC1]MBU6528349.1 hypothetical protein [Methylocystis sp. MJC1]UZX11254.1 hypothetical protein OGR47_15425 [Methylocystis sp. MJC1]